MAEAAQKDTVAESPFPETKKPKISRSCSRQLRLTDLYRSKGKGPGKSSPLETSVENADEMSEGTTDSLADTLTLSPTLTQGEEECIPSWRGTPISDLCFGPSAYPLLASQTSSPTCCVLYKTPARPGTLPSPYPVVFKDIWDEQHVRQPCSSQCLYPIGSGASGKLLRKWDMICSALRKPMASSLDLEEAILSYNSRFAKKWRFRLLHCYFTEFADADETKAFFSFILPKMVDLALSLPKLVTHALPLLRKQEGYSISLSQQQAACLLANAFFCTYPRRNTTAPGSEYTRFPTINFNTLFCAALDTTMLNKLRFILHYFKRVTEEMPTGTLTFARQVCTNTPSWDNCTTPLSKLHVTSEGLIESTGQGMLQVDFANKYIGGGVLGHGCVQEEIRFLICPELIISRLFTEVLGSNESIVVTGAEQFSSYTGYAQSFQWVGDHIDLTVRDDWGRRQVQIVAIDALVFHGPYAQFKPGLMRRELDKAYCGFMDCDKTSCGRGMAVATGKWGCGAFGGNPYLKTILQWMAASAANRDMVFFTFDSQQLQEDIHSIHKCIEARSISVAELWRILNLYYSECIVPKQSTALFRFLDTKLS